MTANRGATSGGPATPSRSVGKVRTRPRVEDRVHRLIVPILSVLLVAAACGSEIDLADGPLIIENQGGELEGHTPRGFAGSGTGLFAGDNLNPNFPNGEGIQILLTFELPEGAPSEITTATLASGVMEVRGNPFEALGSLQAEPVTYETFGPPLFELAADGPAVTCERFGETGITCDVSEAAAAALADNPERVQFRLQFEGLSDSDNEQDLALFFFTDANTNEPGIFTLQLS